MPAKLIFGIIFAIAIFSIWKSHVQLKRLQKYEFENRTSGGVVEFSSFTQSEKHEIKKRFAGLLAGVGWILLMLSVIGYGLATVIK